MFSISPQDPYHPKLLGRPQPTLGETPVSVSYSPKLKTGNPVPPLHYAYQMLNNALACVTNGGSPAGVTCFSASAKGLTSLGPLRLLPQTQLADSTPPPPGPLVLTPDIAFNPSSTALFVTFRSNGALPGSIYAFPVQNGEVGRTPVRSQFSDIEGSFSLNFLAKGNSKKLSDERLIVTNAFVNLTGAALLEVAYPSLQVTQTTPIPLSGQQGTCWVAYDPCLSKSAYVMDAGQPQINVVDPGTGVLEKRVNFTNGGQPVKTGSGAFDTRIDREWVYVLTGKFSLFLRHSVHHLSNPHKWIDIRSMMLCWVRLLTESLSIRRPKPSKYQRLQGSGFQRHRIEDRTAIRHLRLCG